MKRIDYRLYLVTDDPSRYVGNWLDNVVAAVEGGVTCVQYRDTESGHGMRFARAKALQDALKGRHVALVINNEAELAAAIGAEGVHVGQGDMAVESVREIVGKECEIGLSLTSDENATSLLTAVWRGEADSVGIGPVFDARKTKADASAAMGTDGLKTIVGMMGGAVPTVAIGGITLENAAEVLATGVDGIAVVSAFSKAEDPYGRAKDFSMLLDGGRQ